MSAILTPVAPLLHNDGWAPVLGNPDSTHAELQGTATPRAVTSAQAATGTQKTQSPTEGPSKSCNLGAGH